MRATSEGILSSINIRYFEINDIPYLYPCEQRVVIADYWLFWYWLPASCFYYIHYPETASPVTKSIGFQPKPLRWLSAYPYPCEQRFWLEASTFSNRGEMRQHLPTD